MRWEAWERNVHAALHSQNHLKGRITKWKQLFYNGLLLLLLLIFSPCSIVLQNHLFHRLFCTVSPSTGRSAKLHTHEVPLTLFQKLEVRDKRRVGLGQSRESNVSDV